MARLLGVKADRVIAFAFGLSGGLAGVVSLLYVSKTGVLDFRMGVPLAIAGFVGTVIGGVGNLVGAVLGGFFLGVASVLLQALLPEDLRPARDAFLYSLVILVLLVRPQGLFVRRAVGSAFETHPLRRRLSSRRGLIPALGVLCVIVHYLGGPLLEGALTEALIYMVMVIALYVFLGNSGSSPSAMSLSP